MSGVEEATRVPPPELSVVICTHNPRMDFLERTLASLVAQDLPKELWELIVVDNKSKALLDKEISLRWHPRSRVIREDNIGLTNARISGIKESSAPLIIFVDDDNVLRDDYLSRAREIFRLYSFLGAWGGSVVPEFETAPAKWTRPYWGHLAIRPVHQPRWSNIVDDWASQPNGAGLCVRRAVAAAWVGQVKDDKWRRSLGRTGQALLSHEDTDIVLACEKFSWGWGVFPDLELTHLIPSHRLTKNYLEDLIEGWSFSGTIFQFRRFETMPQITSSVYYCKSIVRKLLRSGLTAARFERRRLRGAHKAGVEIRKRTQCDQ